MIERLADWWEDLKVRWFMLDSQKKRQSLIKMLIMWCKWCMKSVLHVRLHASSH